MCVCVCAVVCTWYVDARFMTCVHMFGVYLHV